MEANGNERQIVQPLLTDLYQITMTYAYWKNNKHNDHAVFDLFFRRNPFKGEFTIFAGLYECLQFLKSYHFSDSDINYLKTALPSTIEDGFFDYLKNLTPKDVTIYALPEGKVAFPRIPLIVVEGPLAMCQMLETTFLTLVNYASLVTTNAARFRLAAGFDKQLLEFGLRRAQGPDGGLSASKYCYVGGFDGTSNVLAGKLYNIPIRGTHAHSFITSFKSPRELTSVELKHAKDGKKSDFLKPCEKWLLKVCETLNILSTETKSGELAAFIAYALAFPTSFLCLLDSYDVLRSGLPNFLAVTMALNDFGYQALGVRLDSGDLAYQSKKLRESFRKITHTFNVPFVEKLTIVASNDINEDTLLSLHQQQHEIDSFGIGTHLVTCQKQPALGCVYKLVECSGEPRIKLSEDQDKLTIPGRKIAYRLYGKDNMALVDLLQLHSQKAPTESDKILCRHPFQEQKRAYVTPFRVEKLHHKVWAQGKICEQQQVGDLKLIRENVLTSLASLRPDHIRTLNPTPYKVSVTDDLYKFIHELWLAQAPIGELS